MGPEFIVDSPVLTFGEEMQIYLAHNRAVTVWIARRPFRAGVGGEMKVIIQITCPSGDRRTEETVAVDFFRFDLAAAGMAVQHHRNPLNVGSKNTYRQI